MGHTLTILLPPHALRGATDPWVEAVAGIKLLVEIDQCRLRVVQMAEVVLSRELRATRVQQSPYGRHDKKSARNTAYGESDSRFHRVRSRTQRDHVLDLAAVDGTEAYPSTGSGETVQECLFAFVIRAFEEVSLCHSPLLAPEIHYCLLLRSSDLGRQNRNRFRNRSSKRSRNASVYNVMEKFWRRGGDSNPR